MVKSLVGPFDDVLYCSNGKSMSQSSGKSMSQSSTCIDNIFLLNINSQFEFIYRIYFGVSVVGHLLEISYINLWPQNKHAHRRRLKERIFCYKILPISFGLIIGIYRLAHRQLHLS